MANFTKCGKDYMSSPANQDKYGFSGHTMGIPPNRSVQISTHGCLELCGNGADYYDWGQSSNTITTWVLPVIGIILQAPFVSNAFWETMFSIARWVGSPIATLTYILWNIKVTGKCALMADMAGPYKNSGVDSDFAYHDASMRDSLYLLTTMNQYAINPQLMRTNRCDSKPAEGLLRIVLFSKDLRLLKRRRIAHELEHDQPIAIEPTNAADGLAHELKALDRTGTDGRYEPPDELNAMRQKLAQQLRETRRRGVVPVFVSTLWFLFALAISIQSSFGYLGQNSTAHDLALGCFLAWLPVLILCSIVDRNPVSADDSRKKLNRLVDHVRKSLMDEQVRNMFVNTIDAVEERTDMRRRIEDVSLQCAMMDGIHFFEKFAGQGRIRWQYGAAHPILCDIEDAYIASEGRFWLRDEARARTFLVLGKRMGGLDWLDYRELWQVAAAGTCIFGTILGAWILSFFTPTMGLGCRSGGYTVFLSVTIFLLIVEMALWWRWDATKRELHAFQRRATLHHSKLAKLFRYWSIWSRLLGKWETAFSAWAVSAIKLLFPRSVAEPVIQRLRNLRDTMKEFTPQQRWECFFFRPVEAGNTVYLLYRTLSQTFGADNTCDCMSSTWVPHKGGYIDFVQWNKASTVYVKNYWIAGTTVSVATMGTFMAYIVLEYCLQSHLSTSDPGHAARGLQRVRIFRRLTFPARWVLHQLGDASHSLEVAVIEMLKAWDILSPDFKPRPIGLRWSKEMPPCTTKLPSSHQGRARAESGTPLMTLTSADGVSPEQVPHPHVAHLHSAPRSYEREASPNDDSRLLSPEASGWPIFEQGPSSRSSSRQSTSSPSPRQSTENRMFR